ncbi:MAG TPA: SCO family protein [Gaiellaceae bacterium]|nr:SCO family protein [Gaiellaceae bacterium]
MARAGRVTRLVLPLLALLLVGAGCGSGKSRASFVGPTLQHPSQPPDFSLADQHGRVVHLAGLRGKVVLLTFLYTHCPDVCPITASNLNTALRRLGPERRDVEVLAVSVDPVGDTPASVASFVRVHGLLPQFHYLTAPAARLGRVWRAYGVSAVRKGGNDVDHTLYTMLIDRSGTARVLFDATATPRAVEHDVRQLLA